MKMAQKKRVLLLANAVSGTNNAVDNLFDIVESLSEKGCIVAVYPIDPAKGLVSEDLLANLPENQFDVIACCGGDGTLNHVMNQMMINHIDLPIGYFPTGSTNDFSRSINGGRQLTLEEQCKVVAGNHIYPYDVGNINGEYFNYIAAFGAFTEVSYDTSQNLKNTLGYAAYVLNLIAHIPNGLSYHMNTKYTYDGGSGEGNFIFGAVANTTSIGGVKSPLIQNSELNDGKFEVILITVPKNIIDLNRIMNKMTSGDTDDTYVIKFTTSHISFEFESEVKWTLDGEASKERNTADVTCEKQAMKILTSE
jgi:YegS/Rv2252/BmrU family lipid kinase